MLQPAKVKRTNDFAFKLANVNGTGSASANGLIMQAIFRMGIPVSGKNLFPSNIQGLPTWYEVRVRGDGYTARTPDFDLIASRLSAPVIFDGRNLYDPARLARKGFAYYAIGRGLRTTDARPASSAA